MSDAGRVAALTYSNGAHVISFNAALVRAPSAWRIRVNDRCRFCFACSSDGPGDVEFTGYH